MVRSLLPFFVSPVWAACWFLLMLAVADVQGDDGCSPQPCGNLTISYPFWLHEPGRPPCGHPSFQLKCNSSGAFLSRSVRASYRVVGIFVENSSVHVVDDNLPLATGCPAPLFNISRSLGMAPFVISKANTKLLVLSGCKEPPPGFRRLSCHNHSSVWLGERVHGGLPPGCLSSVVPILGTSDGNGDDYVARMRTGFLLEWTTMSGDCPKCMASGGECRYRDNGLGFACNCSDGVRPEKCGELAKLKIHDEFLVL